MKEQNLVEQKIIENKHKGISSPMRTLFKLTVNVKKSKNNSLEKRKKLPSSSIFSINYNQLNKNNYDKNEDENEFNSSIFRKRRKNNSMVDITDKNYKNYNNNFNKKLNDELIINDIQYYINDNNNKYIIERNTTNNKKINYNYNNNNTKEIKNDIRGVNNGCNKNKNLKPKKIELKNEIIKNNRIKNNNINYDINKTNKDFNKNTKISYGVFNYKINKNLQTNNKLNLKNANNNKNNIISKNISKGNIKEIEMPYTNSEIKYNIIPNNNLKNNNTIKINNNNYISLNKNLYGNNNINNSNSANETYQREEFYLNRYNLGNGNNIISPNQNIIFNIKKQNIKKVNNILINTKNLDCNAIYSPKRALARVHSQENVINKDKDIEKINSITENRLIFKNRSVKDLSGFTYTKKNNLQKTRNNSMTSKKPIINVESPKNNLIDKYFINSCSNINNYNDKRKIFNNNNANLFTKQDYDYLDEKKYDIEPDIYPEIKINLRSKNHKSKNNSVIIEKNNRYNINYSNLDIKDEETYKNSKKKIYNQYPKNKNINKSIDANLINNNDKNINNSFLSNINKSIIFSNTNNSINSNTFSDIGLLSSKNLKYNNKKILLSSNDIYYILVLEEKIKDLAEYTLKSQKMEYIQNYCFDLINYYFNFSIFKYIQKAITDVIDINNILAYNNYTIFSLIILYDLTFEEKIFGTVKILIKEIIKLLYSNIILIINHSKNLINNSEENITILYHIINNIGNKYLVNKDLYLDDNEYLLIEKHSKLSFEEKIDYNINFIIRNIHTIINNMKNTKNYNNFLNYFKKLINISFEEINQFFRDNIYKANIINSTILCSKILNNSNINKIIPPYISYPNKKEFSLVISLDETLIHFKSGSIKNNKGVIQLRPGINEFFEAIKPYYEIIIFSNGNKKYTDLIVNSIDEKKTYIDYRLYRDHCITICNDFVKDISRIGRPINKIVVVDNIPQNYRLHKENGINIKSFYGDKSNDKILFSLNKILINIAKNGGDVRDSIKKYWNEIISKISSNIYINYYNK